LNYTPIPIVDLIGKGKNEKTMDQLPPEEVSVYACEDADITLQLYEELKPLLEKDNLTKLAETVEFPLVRVLAKMEQYGVLIDQKKLKTFSKLLADDLKAIRVKIFEKAECEFNLNSPQQLAAVLFDELGLPPGKKTKTGQYSTSESVMSKLAVGDTIPYMNLEYSALTIVKS